jgi:aspartate/methionine/tyrosine aminotransferase
MGWAVGEVKLIERAWQVKDLTTVIDAYPMEELAERLLAERERFRAPVRKHADGNREVVMAWARGRGLQVVEPPGGIIAAVRLPAGVEAHAFNDRLVAEHDARVVPGDFFGLPGFVRLGFGGETENLREGLKRFGAAMESMRR